MNKKSLINRIGLILTILAFIGGLYIGHNYVGSKNNKNTSIEDVQMVDITVTVEGKSKSVEAKSGMSVMDIMQENYSVQTQYDGTFISGIDDVVGDETKFLAFYINGEMAMVGANDYIVKSGDKIEFKLTEIE